MSSFALTLSFLLPCLSVLFSGSSAWGAYANYNNVLLGERAAGLGGAYTALAADPAATPYYNPATTILQEGSSFSGTVSVYDKSETTIGTAGDFSSSAARMNRGFFRAIPSSGGTILNFKTFAAGISILHPDYDFYNGEIQGESNTKSTLNYIDQSLWVGGTFSTRLSEVDAVGISLYYTARTYQRSVDDHLSSAGSATITTEEKNLTSNNLVAILGYHRQLGDKWAVGVSYRPPSVQVAGEGTYYKSTTVVSPFSTSEIYHGSTRAVTHVPQKLAVGVAREVPNSHTLSFDVSFYGADTYLDFPEAPDAADDLHYHQVANFALGYEQFVRPWLSLRGGIFTNLSSADSPSDLSGLRQMDQLNLYGWSANFCIRAHEQTTFTFGGYYEGGSGLSTQLVGNAIRVTTKSQQIFTMLVGTGFHF